MASITATGWKNKGGTAERSCKCGTWKQHWLNFSGKSWPNACSVKGCSAVPTLGAHVHNPSVSGERIIPMCTTCNKKTDSFDVKADVTFVKANKAETCEK